MPISGTPHLASIIAFYAIIACWWLFGLTFWLRKAPRQGREKKRDRTSLFGLLLQAAGYLIVWLSPLRQRHFSPATSGSQAIEWAVAALAVTLALASVWLMQSATRRLGKQWALTARLVEDHTLVQDGPYGWVRNPIYTAMFGMLLATGLAIGHWIPLLIGVALFLPGTYIRIRSEERLLRQAFGAEFETYTRRVPAFLPGI